MTNSLLKKYFEGKATPEEQEVVENYLQGYDHETLDRFRESVKAASELQVIRQSREVTGKLIRKPFQKLIAAAAIIAVVLSITLIYQQANNVTKPLDKQLVKVVNPWKLLENDEKGIKNIRLPDGTTIWMDVNTVIGYRDDYNEHGRDVLLKGRAYFQVAKMPEKPFRVYVDSLCITALGTAFNIDHNTDENLIKVSLIEGKVSVKESLQNKEIILTPGLEVSCQNGMLNGVHAFDVNMISNWRNNSLHFENSSLAYVFKSLGEKYNTKINYNLTDLRGVTFTGTLKCTEDLRNILEGLAHANGFKVKRQHDSTYKIYK
jgi:transmembrane sensor